MQQKSTLTRFQVEGDAAADYQQFLVPAIFERWAAMLIGVADLQDGDRVLDLACGTGVVARTAATRVGPTGRVVGVDVNDAMLTVARGSGSEIDYQSADATELPFADAAFDAVVCQQGLQFFPDRLGALHQVRRVLDRGGQATVAVWRSMITARCSPSSRTPCNATPGRGRARSCARRSSSVRGMRSERSSLRPSSATSGWRSRSRLSGSPRRRRCSRPRCAAPRSPRSSRAWTRTDHAPRRGARGHVGSHQDDDGVIFPIESHVIVARP